MSIIREIISCTNDNVAIVGSTGMISRELYEIRQTEGKKQINDFFTVGGMCHASQIALGIAKNLPDKKVICLDGDGSLLMHMGSMAECATMKNLIHIPN